MSFRGDADEGNDFAGPARDRYFLPPCLQADMRTTSVLGAALALAVSFSPIASAQCPTWTVDSPFPHFNERFATSVAVDGGTWVVGSPGHFGEGRAQVYSSSPEGAVFEGYLWPGELQALDSFGATVAVDGDTIVVGAPGDDDGTYGAGAVYVYERIMGTWIKTAKLTSAWPTATASFGSSLAVEGDWIAVGAPYDSKSITYGGRVSLFQRTEFGWQIENELPGTHVLERFGASLALEEGRLAVGAPGFSGGRVELYELVGESWVPGAVLEPQAIQHGDEFGSSVTLDGALLVAGARSDSVVAPGAGAAYVFGELAGGWVELQRLQADIPVASDRFGGAVELSGGFLAVGMPGSDIAAPEGGAVTFFAGGALNGTSYQPFVSEQYLLPLGAAGGEQFGTTIGMGPLGMWVGAPGEDTLENDAGRAHAYSFVDIGCASLSVGPKEVSSHDLTALTFELDAGPDFAGQPYFMLGTSQSYAGPTMLGGMAIPLTGPDDYTMHLLHNVNQNGQVATAAYLDANGRGKARVDLGMADVALLNGMQLSHVFFCFTPEGQTTFVSSVATTQVIW